MRELAPAIAASRFVLIADSEMKKLKVDELRRELKNRGIGTGGLKKDLQARLKKAMEDRVPIVSALTKEAASATVFGEGVYWKTLVPNEEAVSDPSEGTDFHAPTVGAEEVPVVKKRNFSATFDRQPFIAHRNVDIVDRFKRRKLDPQTKKVMQEKETFVTGGPTAEFLSDNNLDHTSLPHEWFEPFAPRSLTSL